MPLFRASLKADNIYALTGQALEDRGIRLLLADLDNTLDRKSTRLNSSHFTQSRMPSSA